MAENIHPQSEQLLPKPEAVAERGQHIEQSSSQAENTHDSDVKLENLRHHIENQAVSGKEIPVGDKERLASQSTGALTRDLKQRAYWRTIHRIRTRLSPQERLMSRVIHQPLIDKISTLSTQTVARPSGLLGAALCAFLGNIALLYTAKRYGIHYNYLAFMLFFIAGYCIGIVLELILKIIRPKH